MSAVLDAVRTLLLPLTPLYRVGLRWRERRLASGAEPVRRLPFPIVSIGNLSTGGSGKTPLTIALARGLRERGFAVNVLSRGYGRKTSEAARVALNGSASDFGDEPVLIARETGVPVFVAAERYEAGLLAVQSSAGSVNSGPMVGLLDDGFQHRQLHRDVDILLVSRLDWHDRLLPAGNLREERDSAKRADVIAIPAEDALFEADVRRWLDTHNWKGQIWRIRRRMEISAPLRTDGVARAFAFCGIARPAQFFVGLEGEGVALTGSVALRDHHWYTEGDLRRLDEEARATGAQIIVTTEKDMVRFPAFRWSLPLVAVRLRSEVEDEPAAIEWLARRLASEAEK